MNDANCRHVPAGLFFRFLLDRPRALSVGLMLAVLPVGALLLISWLMSSMDGKGPDYRTILAKGAPVAAEVVATEPVTEITLYHRNPVRITYRYQAGGLAVTDAVQTMAEAGYDLAPGQKVTARVLGGDSILPGLPPVALPGWAIAVIGGAFFLMGLPFLLFALRGAAAKQRLYRTGRLIGGEIDSLAPAFCVPFTPTRIQVAFTGTTHEGRAVKGATVVVVDETWEGKRRGGAVRILVDDISPEGACVVEEAVLARCATNKAQRAF